MAKTQTLTVALTDPDRILFQILIDPDRVSTEDGVIGIPVVLTIDKKAAKRMRANYRDARRRTQHDELPADLEEAAAAAVANGVMQFFQLNDVEAERLLVQVETLDDEEEGAELAAVPDEEQ